MAAKYRFANTLRIGAAAFPNRRLTFRSPSSLQGRTWQPRLTALLLVGLGIPPNSSAVSLSFAIPFSLWMPHNKSSLKEVETLRQ